MIYDVAVIGAGINGCMVSYFLKNAGESVALIDKEGVASGGSGAAGAFISPKFSKGGELKELINKAYIYALDFYTDNFAVYIKTAPLLHFAKYSDEIEKLQAFKQTSTLASGSAPAEALECVRQRAKECEYVYLLKSGVVDAAGVCHALVKDIDFFIHEVSFFTCKGDYYQIGEIKAKRIVLANGAYKPIVDEPYIKLRGIWGHRIDISSSTNIPVNLHQFVSISASNNSQISIGATHDVHFHPQTSKEPYNIQKGRDELLQKASQTVNLEDIKILKDYTGLRSGSHDYLPLVGAIVKSEESLDKVHFYKKIYIINGVGGYGFVLAPYIAKQLSEFITTNSEIDAIINPARFFYRYQKKQKK